jgi:hypothetical protein
LPTVNHPKPLYKPSMFIQRKGIQDYDTNHALIREKILVKQTKKIIN